MSPMLNRIVRLLSINALAPSVMVWLLIGCAESSAASSLSEQAVIEDCALPCWGGVTPGVTSATDTENILRERYKRIWKEYTQDVLSLDWASDSGYAHRGSVQIRDGVAKSILVWFREGQITVDDFIRIAGKPDYMRVELPGEFGGVCGFDLMYPDLGTRASSGSTGTIDGSETIGGLTITRAGTVSYNPIAEKVEWMGYGDYGSHCHFP